MHAQGAQGFGLVELCQLCRDLKSVGVEIATKLEHLPIHSTLLYSRGAQNYKCSCNGSCIEEVPNNSTTKTNQPSSPYNI